MKKFMVPEPGIPTGGGPTFWQRVKDWWGRTFGSGKEAAKGAAEAFKIAPKIAKQMGSRGWTQEGIQEAIKSGKQVRALNKATGNAATRYVHPKSGQSVVVDDVTGEVIHVGGPGFKYGPGSGDLP
jgi:hypothetical protein